MSVALSLSEKHVLLLILVFTWSLSCFLYSIRKSHSYFLGSRVELVLAFTAFSLLYCSSLSFYLDLCTSGRRVRLTGLHIYLQYLLRISLERIEQCKFIIFLIFAFY
jgi:hypothetical protein